ncbi:MAG: translation initiation factor IF-2 [Candidatus Bathyarchaeia archaeon]
MAIRCPVVTVLGHVDVGKTLLLDHIRKTSVQAREAGGLTQHVGASFFPVDTLIRICGPLLEKVKGRIKIPGLLVIDTPGHEIFTNLRKRGGAVADIAILVIDIVSGVQAQTHESIDILRLRKTPFIVAANKIDLIPGWSPLADHPVMESYSRQEPGVRTELDGKIYEMIGDLSKLGFKADRFDRVKDFTKNVAIVPVSAKTGEGIVELLSVLVGLSQQYLTGELLTTTGPAKGSVLEVKEETGLGTTIDTIIHDGVIREGDRLVIGGKTDPIVTSVRALLMPRPLDEIRDPRYRFQRVEVVHAAAGVKIAGPNLDSALAGSPVYVIPPDEDETRLVSMVKEEIEKILIKTDKIGVVVKADALGSLEALIGFLSEKGVKVRMADVGDVSRRDIVESSVVRSKDPSYGAVLAFGVKVLPDAQEGALTHDVRIITHDVMYQLVDEYLEWSRSIKMTKKREEMEKLVRPGKIEVLRGFVFRRSKPAIFGVKVVAGMIEPKSPMVNQDGVDAGDVMQIQEKGETIARATVGMEVAISMMKPIIGKHLNEGDVLYVAVPERDAKLLMTRFKSDLSSDELEALEELVGIMRKTNPLWGV